MSKAEVVFVYPWGEVTYGRLPQLVDELLREKVDVLVTTGGRRTKARTLSHIRGRSGCAER